MADSSAKSQADRQRDLAAAEVILTSLQNAFTGAWNAIVTTVAQKVQEVSAAVEKLGALLGPAIASATAAAVAAAEQLGRDIVLGIGRGLQSLSGWIGEQAASMARGALSAAKAALGAQSPSQEFEDLGVDSGQGLINGFEKIKLPVRNAAQSLAEQALEAFRDTADKANQIIADFNAQAVRIGQDVGRKINEAVVEAARQLQDAMDQAAQRIQDLGESLSLSRSDRARRDALRDDQDQRRQKRKRDQEDADAVTKRDRELADARFQLIQDMNNADTDAERQKAEQKFTDKQADIRREFDLDLANRTAQRLREQDDANFERTLDQETQDLNDKLENEALDRQVARIIEERDARITAINEALTEKQNKIREQGAQELVDLRENVNRKLQVLEDQYVNKAVDLLQKGGEEMRPLIEGLTDTLQMNFQDMKGSADEFTDSINRSIDALNRLEKARQRADVGDPIQPPNIPGPEPDPNHQRTGGLQFQHGGTVPGPWGKPLWAMLHGGEQVIGLTDMKELMTNMAAYRQSQVVNNYSWDYNVDAHYREMESPSSVEMDLRAIVALSRA
jgi:hypothetical protein